jgi:phytoene dehydrogenase-like protein
MERITVVGGGLAGLIAASEIAEAGVPVRLLEARRHLGGRARSTSGPYRANLGPHALYANTQLWRWLRDRGLHRPSHRPQPRRLVSGIRFRWHGDLRALPPAAARRALQHARLRAPVDRDLRSWMTDMAGEDAAQVVSGAAGPLVFDHDAGRLSAAFVMEKVRSVLLRPVTPARYVEGGWNALVERIANHARAAGAVVEVSHRVTALDDIAAAGPVIIAVEPAAARTLLGADDLQPEVPSVVLVDVGVERRHGDPYLVFDLDEGAFLNRASAVVPSVAPAGCELIQASLGVRPGEGLESGVARIEALLDQSFAGWRARTTWYRRGLATESTGAVDLPGTTWRTRTPVAYADRVWLAGDWVAAPGHLAEVACNSAIRAAREAVAAYTSTVWTRPAVHPASSGGSTVAP